MIYKKYKVGDRVKIQSLEQYNKYKNRYGVINYGDEDEILFTSEMSSFCGQVATISQVRYIGCVRFYHLAEDKGLHLWVGGMFEGLVEEESSIELTVKGEEIKERIEIAIPEGYEYVIESDKIIFTKKKKEYPKTYEECCEVLNYNPDFYDATKFLIYGYMSDKLRSFQKLLVCRDAYWKIYGEENGLGKPWEPRWNDGDQGKRIINFYKDEINLDNSIKVHFVLAFPTEEMRDAFFDNFKSEIEICKELL